MKNIWRATPTSWWIKTSSWAGICGWGSYWVGIKWKSAHWARWGKVGEFEIGTWFWILKLSQKGVSSPSNQSVVCAWLQLSFLALSGAQFCRAVCLQHWSSHSLIILLLLSKTNICQELTDLKRLHITLLCTSREKKISSGLYSEQNTSMLEYSKLERCSLYIHTPFFLPSCQMALKYNLEVTGILWDSKCIF